eukprot:364698-Chlamydomonas_euryale.AAC.1
MTCSCDLLFGTRGRSSQTPFRLHPQPCPPVWPHVPGKGGGASYKPHRRSQTRQTTPHCTHPTLSTPGDEHRRVVERDARDHGARHAGAPAAGRPLVNLDSCAHAQQHHALELGHARDWTGQLALTQQPAAPCAAAGRPRLPAVPTASSDTGGDPSGAVASRSDAAHTHSGDSPGASSSGRPGAGSPVGNDSRRISPAVSRPAACVRACGPVGRVNEPVEEGIGGWAGGLGRWVGC